MTCWVLLRGLMREQRHWGEFPAQLGRALPDAVIVTPDLPGNGTRHTLRSATRVADMVEFCRQDLQARGLRPPYALLALSLGGMVAVEWASLYPGEIERCVLINTSMRPYGRFHERLRWQNYPAVLAQLARGGIERQERLILRLTSNGTHGPRTGAGATSQRVPLLAQWTAYQREYPVSRPNVLRQLGAAARFRAPPVPPPVPLLILASAGDRLVDHHCSLRLAAAWNAPLAVHPGAGHDLPLDDGAWIIEQVARWLPQK
jgi:pimeloyl-ACP methyl ester carboxylesterase